MGISDYFKPVSSWSAEEVRTFLNEKGAEKYNLVDVRQPKEYEQGHLPGAQLIPLGELANRVKELDPNKPTIAY
jgi:rhodanese-related sulfurtransferase